MGLISDTAGSQSRFYLWDGLGNLRSLLSPTGTVLWQGDWSAFGSPVCPAGAPPTAYAWKGHFGAYTDGESKLVEMGARYYAPNLARFLTRDPSSFSAGPNLYAFCADDPVNFFDPDGCGPEEGEGWFWDGMRSLGDKVDEARAFIESFGLKSDLPNPFGELRDAHDAVYDWGYSVGNAKASPDEVRSKAVMAGFRTAMAAISIYCMGRMLTGGFEEPEAEGCFVAGVPVWVISEQGTVKSAAKIGVRTPHLSVKPVEEVRQGERVATRDSKTGKLEAKRVLRTTVRQVPVVVSVGLAEAKSGKVVDTLTATREHPFFVRGTGFVPAGGLAIGNAIVTCAGPDLVVKSLKWHRRAEGYKVYNFIVEDDHSYFVGLHNGGAWVHNALSCPGASQSVPKIELPEKTNPQVVLQADKDVAQASRQCVRSREPADENGSSEQRSGRGDKGAFIVGNYRWVRFSGRH